MQQLFPQIRRDMDWLAQSSPLVGSSMHSAFLSVPTPEFSSDKKQSLLKNKSKIINALMRSQSQRLGIYYEILWQQWLALYPEITLLSKNLQVIENGQTLGEFDLLYKYQNNNVIHREMAVKFYLGLPDESAHTTFSQWIGPGLIDRLDKKLEKFQKQINLSNTTAGKKTLAATGIKGKITVEALLQGYLFYPWNQPCQPPCNVLPEHEKGLWLPNCQLPRFLRKLPDSRVFGILEKRQWLSRSRINNNTHNRPFSFLKSNALITVMEQYFTEYDHPVLIACYEINNKYHQEVLRFFTVPDAWQIRARDMNA